jgi:hypothetical protein
MIFYRRYLLLGWMALLLAGGALWLGKPANRPKPAPQQRLARALLLTDLCLSTESRHTRHISLPEWAAPFQDFPGFHDHFPSSTFFQQPGARALPAHPDAR